MTAACVAHVGSAAFQRLPEALGLLRSRFGRVPVYPASDPGDAETLAGELAGEVDVLPLPGIQVLSRLDRLPFASGSVTALRANHVLEHQSWQLVGPTLREWARVLRPGARVDIGVPDARFIVRQWMEGAYTTVEANHWLLGGHMDRDAHKGTDERGIPRWIWNAHHAMFDDAWLAELLAANGFVDNDIFCYDVRNLRCYCRRSDRSEGLPTPAT